MFFSVQFRYFKSLQNVLLLDMMTAAHLGTLTSNHSEVKPIGKSYCHIKHEISKLLYFLLHWKWKIFTISITLHDTQLHYF